MVAGGVRADVQDLEVSWELSGTSYGDIFTMSSQADFAEGRRGDDVLQGGYGDDQLFGGEGNGQL